MSEVDVNGLNVPNDGVLQHVTPVLQNKGQFSLRKVTSG